MVWPTEHDEPRGEVFDFEFACSHNIQSKLFIESKIIFLLFVLAIFMRQFWQLRKRRITTKQPEKILDSLVHFSVFISHGQDMLTAFAVVHLCDIDFIHQRQKQRENEIDCPLQGHRHDIFDFLQFIA